MEPMRTLIVRAVLIYSQLMLLSRRSVQIKSLRNRAINFSFQDFHCNEGKSFRKSQATIITYRSCKSCPLNEMKKNNDIGLERFPNKRPIWFLKVFTQLLYD